MGMVYANVELINVYDMALARRRYLNQDEVKKMSINILANSGSFMMAINENIQAYLQLPFLEKRKSVMAYGSTIALDVVGINCKI